MVNMFLTAIRTGFVEDHLRIQYLVSGRIGDDALVFNNLVVRTFKYLVFIRTDKNQFHSISR